MRRFAGRRWDLLNHLDIVLSLTAVVVSAVACAPGIPATDAVALVATFFLVTATWLVVLGAGTSHTSVLRLLGNVPAQPLLMVNMSAIGFELRREVVRVHRLVEDAVVKQRNLTLALEMKLQLDALRRRYTELHGRRVSMVHPAGPQAEDEAQPSSSTLQPVLETLPALFASSGLGLKTVVTPARKATAVTPQIKRMPPPTSVASASHRLLTRAMSRHRWAHGRSALRLRKPAVMSNEVLTHCTSPSAATVGVHSTLVQELSSRSLVEAAGLDFSFAHGAPPVAPPRMPAEQPHSKLGLQQRLASAMPTGDASERHSFAKPRVRQIVTLRAAQEEDDADEGGAGNDAHDAHDAHDTHDAHDAHDTHDAHDAHNAHNDSVATTPTHPTDDAAAPTLPTDSTSPNGWFFPKAAPETATTVVEEALASVSALNTTQRHWTVLRVVARMFGTADAGGDDKPVGDELTASVDVPGQNRATPPVKKRRRSSVFQQKRMQSYRRKVQMGFASTPASSAPNGTAACDSAGDLAFAEDDGDYVDDVEMAQDITQTDINMVQETAQAVLRRLFGAFQRQPDLQKAALAALVRQGVCDIDIALVRFLRKVAYTENMEVLSMTGMSLNALAILVNAAVVACKGSLLGLRRRLQGIVSGTCQASGACVCSSGAAPAGLAARGAPQVVLKAACDQATFMGMFSSKLLSCLVDVAQEGQTRELVRLREQLLDVLSECRRMLDHEALVRAAMQQRLKEAAQVLWWLQRRSTQSRFSAALLVADVQELLHNAQRSVTVSSAHERKVNDGNASARSVRAAAAPRLPAAASAGAGAAEARPSAVAPEAVRGASGGSAPLTQGGEDSPEFSKQLIFAMRATKQTWSALGAWYAALQTHHLHLAPGSRRGLMLDDIMQAPFCSTSKFAVEAAVLANVSAARKLRLLAVGVVVMMALAAFALVMGMQLNFSMGNPAPVAPMCAPLGNFTHGPGTLCPAQASAWVDDPSLYVVAKPDNPANPRHMLVEWVHLMAPFLQLFAHAHVPNYDAAQCAAAMSALACEVMHTPCGADCQPRRMCASRCQSFVHFCIDDVDAQAEVVAFMEQEFSASTVMSRLALSALPDPAGSTMLFAFTQLMGCREPFIDTSPRCEDAVQPVAPPSPATCSAPRQVAGWY